MVKNNATELRSFRVWVNLLCASVCVVWVGARLLDLNPFALFQTTDDPQIKMKRQAEELALREFRGLLAPTPERLQERGMLRYSIVGYNDFLQHSEAGAKSTKIVEEPSGCIVTIPYYLRGVKTDGARVRELRRIEMLVIDGRVVSHSELEPEEFTRAHEWGAWLQGSLVTPFIFFLGICLLLFMLGTVGWACVLSLTGLIIIRRYSQFLAGIASIYNTFVSGEILWNLILRGLGAIVLVYLIFWLVIFLIRRVVVALRLGARQTHGR